jgi:glyoxylase-like metal-dependent hydrolase (beta-lactamase superfamily II)
MRTSSVFGMALGFSLALGACSDTGSSGATSNTGGAGSTGEPTTGSTGSGATGSTGSSSGSGSGSGSSSSGGGFSGFKIAVYASDPAGPAVNSVLITGEKDAILVDGQFFSADATKVIDLVKASGKTLKTVVLTHAHPDHYLGLEPIHAAFPDAPVVATKDVVADFKKSAQGTLDFLKTMLGTQIPDKLVTLTELSGATIDLEGQALQVIELPNPGESEHSAAIGLSNPSALIAGDLIYNGIHLVLSECKSQGWLDNLTEIKKQSFTTIYPGHGAQTTMAVIDADAQYIQDVVPIMNAAATADAAKTEIKQKYPAYQSDFLLGFSVDQYFTNCKKP